MANVDTHEAYKSVCYAVILQAVTDYARAIVSDNRDMMADCERFFKSPLYDFYRLDLGLTGQELQDKIRSSVEEFKDKARIGFREGKPIQHAFMCPVCNSQQGVVNIIKSRAVKGDTKRLRAKCVNCGFYVTNS